MTTEEKLQQAALNYKQNKIKSNLDDKYDAFIEGAKSPESLEYWKEKKKLWTNEEVLVLLDKYDEAKWGCSARKQFSEITRWFNQHKK